jgi:hypothetical protein
MSNLYHDPEAFVHFGSATFTPAGEGKIFAVPDDQIVCEEDATELNVDPDCLVASADEDAVLRCTTFSRLTRETLQVIGGCVESLCPVCPAAELDICEAHKKYLDIVAGITLMTGVAPVLSKQEQDWAQLAGE